VSGAAYYAAEGGGALLNARPIRVRRPVDLDDLVFGVYLGSHAAPEASEVAHRARRVRALGAASLDLCLVARGASDLYYMHSSIVNAKLRVVDIAGAVLVVREAGGLVLDLKKKELDMALTSTAGTDLVAVGHRRRQGPRDQFRVPRLPGGGQRGRGGGGPRPRRTRRLPPRGPHATEGDRRWRAPLRLHERSGRAHGADREDPSLRNPPR